MRGAVTREAAFPGERLDFEVLPDGCVETEVAWSGGGSPQEGTGRRFNTAFEGAGEHTVTARCGDAEVELTVTIAPIAEWMARAREFFGPSLDFSKIEVKTSRVVIGRSGTGFTCNDVIRFKRPRREADLPAEPTLIHELGHVWEHQSGQAQLLHGFVEQVGKLLGRDPYDYGGPAGTSRAKSLTAFKLESQAQIVMELWRSRNRYRTDSRGVAFSTPGYVEDLARLVEEAGIGSRAPDPGGLAGRLDRVVAWIVNATVDVLG